MASTTTLKDKITYITITPTPSSPTSSIRTSSFESDRQQHYLDLPFHDNNEKHIESPSEHINAFRQRRSHAVRKIRNIIVSIISLAIIFGLCSTGWGMRGVYDSYTAAAPLALETTQNALDVAPVKASGPVSPSPETLPEVIAAATAAFESAKGKEMSEHINEFSVVVDEDMDELEDEKLDMAMDEDVTEEDTSVEWSEPI